MASTEFQRQRLRGIQGFTEMKFYLCKLGLIWQDIVKQDIVKSEIQFKTNYQCNYCSYIIDRYKPGRELVVKKTWKVLFTVWIGYNCGIYNLIIRL